MPLDAVFLDRDGVINENRADHVKDWSEFQFVPGVLAALARLTGAGVRVFVVSNQAIVNRGMASRAAVDALNRRMLDEIERNGGRVEAIEYCPHRSDEGCSCRKPLPGLMLSLAQRYGVSLGQAAMIGDALTDIEAAHAAGCARVVLVLSGRGHEQFGHAIHSGRRGFLVAEDLPDACDLLLSQPAHTSSATWRQM